MSNKKLIPLPNDTKSKDKKSLCVDLKKMCNCKIPIMNCIWPECVCELCLTFREKCECIKDV